MRFFFNDASLHGQFTRSEEFMSAFGDVMRAREHLIANGRRLEVLRTVPQCKVVGETDFRTTLAASNDRNRIRQVMVWLDRDGPFWDDDAHHPRNEYFECSGVVVTETALAEACFLRQLKTQTSVVSVKPSKFEESPLTVSCLSDAGTANFREEVGNCCSADQLRQQLLELRPEPTDWDQLLAQISADCPNLYLSPEIRTQLGDTFYPAVAKVAPRLFLVLNELCEACTQSDDSALRRIYTSWLNGTRYFSDSSASEKIEFEQEMKFRHAETGETCFCPWHGKINQQVFRIHFEWPMPRGRRRLFVAYFGPKITKR